MLNVNRRRHGTQAQGNTDSSIQTSETKMNPKFTSKNRFRTWLGFSLVVIILLTVRGIGLSSTTKTNLQKRLRPYAVSAIDAFSPAKLDGPLVFGLHQSVETDYIGEAIPTICYGKLFYSNQDTAQNGLSQIPEIASAKVVETSLIHGPELQWSSSCCERCAKLLLCNAFRSEGNECSLLRIGIDSDDTAGNPNAQNGGLSDIELPDPTTDMSMDEVQKTPALQVEDNEPQDSYINVSDDDDESEKLTEEGNPSAKWNNAKEDVDDHDSEFPQSESDERESEFPQSESDERESEVRQSEADDRENMDLLGEEEDESAAEEVASDVDSYIGDSDAHQEDASQTSDMQDSQGLGDLGSLLDAGSSLDSLAGAAGGSLDSLFGDGGLASTDSFMDGNADLFGSADAASLLQDLDKDPDGDEPTRELEEVPATAAEIKSLVSQGVDAFLPMGDYVRQLGPFYANTRKVFSRFRALTTVYATMADAVQYYKEHPLSTDWGVQSIVIGKSAEGTAIRSFEFGNHRRGRHVFVVAGLRGCDWTGPFATLHVAISLLGRMRTMRQVLEHVRFHVIPVANPDGYSFSRKTKPSNARHWCKNRRVLFNSHGVALENNWGVPGISWGFGKEGKEGVRRDDYQGPEPFSEPETRALRDIIANYATGRGRVAVLQVRCCSGEISAPQLYKPKGGGASVDHVAKMLARVMKVPEGTDYSFATRSSPFSATNNGQMIDYLSGEMNVDHAYSVELKASGLATHKDRYQINAENFDPVAKELEYGTVFVTQQLLNMKQEGEPTPTIYKTGSESSVLDSMDDSELKKKGKH